MKKISIQGRMQAITPFHLAHANVKGEVNDSGEPRTVFGSATPALPCTMTYRSPVVASVGTATEDGGLEARIVKVPVMPGTNMRGHIRQKAAGLIKQALIAKGEQIDRPTYHALTVGATAGNGILRGALSASEILAARGDLFVGVFGGGPALFRSHLRTFDAYAACDEIRGMELIPAEANIAEVFLPSASKVTFAQPFVRRDPMIQWLDPLARDVIQNFDKAFMDWQSVVERTQAAKAGQRNAKAAVRNAKKANETVDEETKAAATTKTSKVMLVGHQAVEAVMPGTIFGFRVDVAGTEAQIGLVLQAINDMFAENGFGGFVRNGYGLMAPSLSMIDDQGVRHPFLIGNGISDPTVSEDVQPYLLAAREALSTYTAEQLKRAYLIERWSVESGKLNGGEEEAA